ncbi:MAG TPA: tetratricopeptide repeat protein, partial [Phycisphaerae bacterium]|nr:tetratricopeptide repeat protein [Phycisphaerae bacterium]
MRSFQYKPSSAMSATLLCIAVMLFFGLVYSPLLTAGFADANDAHYLPPRIWNPDWSWEELGRMFYFDRVFKPEGTGGYYQPLTAVSLRIDAWLTRVTSSRVDATGSLGWLSRAFQFHLTNILLHVANVGLVFLLVRRLSHSLLWPALLAVVFACHPVQVESVASIAQRMTLLGTFFSLLSLLSYVQSREARWRKTWIVFSTLGFAASVLCRPQFIALPVVMLVLDVWPFRRAGVRPLIEKIPMFAVMAAAAVIQWHARGAAAVARPLDGGGVESVAHGFASLIARLLIPAGISPFQPATVTVAGLALGLLFDAALMMTGIALVIVCFRRNRPVFAALSGAGLLILPAVLEIPYIDTLPSDQYLYAALLIPIAAFAAWISTRKDLLRHLWGRWTAITLGTIACVFTVHAHALTLDWQSSRTLYERTVSLYPAWVRGHVGLVESLIEENEFDLALVRAQAAAKRAPDDPSIQFYLGTILLLSDDSRAADAIAPLRKALASNRSWIACLQNIGVALVRSGQDQEAIGYLEKARDLQPKSAGIRLGLGNAYLKVRRFASARREFQEALRGRNEPMAHLGLAIAWAANDEFDYARR